MTPEEALQQVLAAEHAAVHLYGVLGGRVSVSAEPDLASAIEEAYLLHRGRRDELVAMVRAEGGDPVAAEVAYELPNAARTAEQLRAAALVVEQRCSGVYADTVGSTAGAGRRWALDALEDAAVRQLTFGGEPETFPGLGEL